MGNYFCRYHRSSSQIPRKECNLHCSWLIFKNDPPIPCLNGSHHQRSSNHILRPHIQASWHITESDLRSRTPICILFYGSALYPPENQRQSLYHIPHQTDGQTEWYSATVKQYLHLYTNLQNNDWVEWLALVEFTHNQKPISSSGYSPFMLNFSQQLNIWGEHWKQVWNESAKEFVEMMQGTIKLAKESLEHTAEDMKKFYNRRVFPFVEYRKGDLVLLEETNIWSDCPSKKLGDKWYGPFKIIEKVGSSAYHLKLDPKWWGVHLVFHECLLHPYHIAQFPSSSSTSQYH